MGGMIQCLRCGLIMHSLSVHDFRQCDCPNLTFIGGGDAYTRWGGMDPDMIRFIDHEHEEKDNEKDN